MNASRMTALLRKEIIEGLRAGGRNIPFTAALMVVMLITTVSGRRAALTPGALSLLQAQLPVFLPLLAIPFYASTVLTRAIQTERLRGGLVPLLIHGGSAAEVWLAKVAGAFALAYGVMLLSLGGYAAYGAWSGRHLAPSLAALPHLLVTMPLAALSVIALQALLFWVMPRSALLSVIVPLTVLFGGTQLVVLWALRPLSLTGAALAVVSSGLVLGLSALVEAHYPRERAAGLVA